MHSNVPKLRGSCGKKEWVEVVTAPHALRGDAERHFAPRETERAMPRRGGMARTGLVATGLVVAGIIAGMAVMRYAAEREANAAPEGPARAADANATPVLVELFTSEGCSSCPPADAVLTRLERTQPTSGARVIALAHHVDYWNGIGWPDPFSSPAATSRQRAYNGLGGGNYTPQAVVDGQAQMVGSRGSALESAIAEASKRPHAKIDLESTPGSTSGTFDVTIKVGALPKGAANDVELLVAIAQTAGRVEVPRGENAGRTLDHSAIARDLRVVGGVANQGVSSKISLKPPAPISGRASFDAIAFVQERTSRRILGTSSIALGPR
jgi:hypothetical protein